MQPEFKILAYGPYSLENLFLEFINLFSPKSDKEFSDYCAGIWEDLIKTKPLYNGNLYNLLAYTAEGKNLTLKMNTTNYFSYVCTRSKNYLQKYPVIERSMPLAVCVSLVTKDNQLIIEKRKGVDVYEGRYHVIGGFLEPEADINSDNSPDPYMGIIREVKEEIAVEVNPSNLSLLGLVEDILTPHYELCFFSKLKISSQKVLQDISTSITDGEVAMPEFIDFNPNSVNRFLNENKGNISATGLPCILMAGRMIFGEAWYTEMLHS